MSGGVVHCRQASYDVYVRPGDDPRSGEPGEWGNPYSHRPSRVPGVIVVGSLGEAIRRHEVWLWQELRSGRLPLARMAALDGRTLGCRCPQPCPCHAHTPRRAARWAATQLRG